MSPAEGGREILTGGGGKREEMGRKTTRKGDIYAVRVLVVKFQLLVAVSSLVATAVTPAFGKRRLGRRGDRTLTKRRHWILGTSHSLHLTASGHGDVAPEVGA